MPYTRRLSWYGRVDEIKDAMSKGNEVGMHTFDQSLFDLYKAGRLSQQDALRYADSHTDLALHIRLTEHLTSGEVPLALDDIADTRQAPK